MTRFNSFFLCAFILFLTTITLGPAIAAAQVTPGSLLWEANIVARDIGPAIEASGIVIVGNYNSDGGLFAFAADSGKPLWKHRGEQVPGNLASDGTHLFAIVDGHTSRRLASFDLKTGKQLWSVEVSYKFGGDYATLIADSGRIYGMGRDGKLQAFAADSGKELWKFLYSPVEDPECHSGLALSNGRLYFGGGMFDRAAGPGKALWAINAATGAEVWHYQSHFAYSSSSDCPNTPVTSGDTIVFTTANVIAAVHASTGKLLWNHPVTVLSGGYPKPLTLSPPVIGSGVIFAADSQALLSWSLDGHPLDELRGQIGSTPEFVHMAANEGTLYFFGNLPADADKPGKYQLHAMDITSRKILWTHRTNRPVPGFTDWQSSYALPTPSGIYYENAKLFAKVAR